MASGDNQETLESWLNKATNPNNEGDRWDYIQGFYQLVNDDPNGPQVATRLLAHKIQSPQEKEALQALTVLEACMNNCGKKFHSEAAKFRFLNELIKILSPKYFGTWMPQTVKDRVIEILFGWTLWLTDEPKIQQAYRMLKKQGVVVKDPKLSNTPVMAPPPQRATESIFDQEDKATLLTRLLKSGRPEDLETANRLIKNTIKEEQEKAEKVSKRESTLKEVERNTKQLQAVLKQQAINGTMFQPDEKAKALYESCDRLRPSLFRLASDTMDDDSALTQILAANDDLTLTLSSYKEQLGKGVCNGGRMRRASEEKTSGSVSPTSPKGTKSYHLIDLSTLDSPDAQRKTLSSPKLGSSSSFFSSYLESSFLSDAEQDTSDIEFDDLGSNQIQEGGRSYFSELLQLNKDIPMANVQQNGGGGIVLRARGCGGSSPSLNGTNNRSVSNGQEFKELGSLSSIQEEIKESVSPLKLDESSGAFETLSNIFVPLESIKSSELAPIVLYNRAGIHVSLHFAKNCPAGHSYVAVAVISAVNTSALAVKDFVFQVAVPKSMSVRLQPASGTHLAPFNPLLPPPAVSQVLLLANPQSRKVRLRYKLTLTQGDKQLNASGEMDNFPDWSSFTGL